jgi:NAD(P)-dependent dehydrogenase (short-subunit alcohol dehydrogenase family)
MRPTARRISVIFQFIKAEIHHAKWSTDMKRSVIVSGAAGGVGQALVEQLLQADRHVIAMVLNDKEEQQLRQALPDVTDVIQCDLGQADTIKPALESLLGDEKLNLEAIVACAGIWPAASIELSSIEEVRRTIEINAIAPFALLQAAIPALRRSRGRVILVSSISGRLPAPLNSAYGMSKYAVEGLADVARRELSDWGIKVTVMQPGPIKTGMVSGIMDGINRRLEGLSRAEKELYGPLYAGVGAMLKNGYPDATPPSGVAAAIVDVLTQDEPATRVPVGEIAKGLYNPHLTDQDLDHIAKSLVSGSGFAQG